MRTKIELIIIIVALLLTMSCNTDNDGIFMQISKSETKVDVGSIALIAKDDTTFYARTREHQVQSYNSDSKEWKTLAYASFATTDGTNLYYAPSVKEGVAQQIYKTPFSDFDPTQYPSDYTIIRMDNQSDLMLVEDNENFSVIKVSNEENKLSGISSYGDWKPQLLMQGEHFLVSSRTDEDKYTQYFDDETETTDINAPVIAFMKSGSNYVFLTAAYDIYTFDGTEFEKAEASGASIFPSGRRPRSMPYPSFVYDGKLYLQNRHNQLVTIDKEGNIESASKITFPIVDAYSYLVDGNKVFIGTLANGIYELDMTTNEVKSL